MGKISLRLKTTAKLTKPRHIRYRQGDATNAWRMFQGHFFGASRPAMSIVYFLVILLLSWVFYTGMTRDDAERPGGAS